jgi:hypothetical protein
MIKKMLSKLHKYYEKQNSAFLRDSCNFYVHMYLPAIGIGDHLIRHSVHLVVELE